MEYAVRVFRNPYPHVVPNLNDILEDVADKTAQLIASRQYHDLLGSNLDGRSVAICLMDPTIHSGAALDAMLAQICIGDQAREFLTTAIAKAFTTWELQLECGVARYVHPHLLADGSSVWGHSPIVEGTIIGASGLTQEEDKFVATVFAADFNLRVYTAHKKWLEAHPDNDWFCNEDIAREAFRRAADMFDSLTLDEVADLDPELGSEPVMAVPPSQLDRPGYDERSPDAG